MKRGSQAPPHRTPGNTAFLFLLVAAWLGVGVLAKLDARWLYFAIGLTVVAALWAGRRQRVLLRVLVLLALVYPAWKIVDRWSPKVASPGERDDADSTSAVKAMTR